MEILNESVTRKFCKVDKKSIKYIVGIIPNDCYHPSRPIHDSLVSVKPLVYTD